MKIATVFSDYKLYNNAQNDFSSNDQCLFSKYDTNNLRKTFQRILL